jgi:3-deoxy-manno-octulosonate cytidylyltransferase (CMP-KDO synthetase)
MIEHVYTRAADVPGVSAVIVATDDERIAEAVTRFGGVVRMTRSTHRTGLERVAEVAADLDCDIVVNVQGDEPLLEPRMVTEVVGALEADETVLMSTLRKQISNPDDTTNPHVVKVVVNLHGDALYFSRAAVPCVHDAARPAFRHIGLYAYRRAFVCDVAALPQTPLEIAESLEQLRALEHGFRVRVLETHYDSIGVDTPEDLERVRRRMTIEARA